MSRTISARISNELHDKLRDSCNDEGCSINERVEKLIKNNLNDSNGELNDMEKQIMEYLPQLYEGSLKEDDDGRPLEAELVWNYEELEKISDGKLKKVEFSSQ